MHDLAADGYGECSPRYEFYVASDKVKMPSACHWIESQTIKK